MRSRWLASESPHAAALPADVAAAAAVAFELLAGVGSRWAHVRAAGERAAEVSLAVPAGDRDLVVCAALLHDIGYAPALTRTGFHPLDGARYLRHLGWSPRLVGLVAHHSEARRLAQARGLARELDEFPAERGLVAVALTYADMTCDPYGRPISVPERLDDTGCRHACDEPALCAARQARVRHLMHAVATVEAALRAGGVELPTVLFPSGVGPPAGCVDEVEAHARSAVPAADPVAVAAAARGGLAYACYRGGGEITGRVLELARRAAAEMLAVDPGLSRHHVPAARAPVLASVPAGHLSGGSGRVRRTGR